MNIINKIKLGFVVKKTRKYTKRLAYDPNRYSLQFRNDFLVKKIAKVFKSFKVNLTVQGYENLGSGPALLVGNHQDNIDALVVLYALKKNTEDKSVENKIPTFIAKHTLQYKASTRYPLSSINTFFLDRDNLKKSLDTYNEFGKFVKENKTFGTIFPEGTRNKYGQVGEFKPGVFKIAKKELLPIIPFTINNSVSGLNDKRKEILEIEIIFHKKIQAGSLMTQNTIAISERVHKIVESKFKKPQYSFDEGEDESKNVEQSKAAIKWHKKEEKKIKKANKKEKQEKDQEKKLMEIEEKENKKYEKYVEKMRLKQQKKEDKKHDK